MHIRMISERSTACATNHNKKKILEKNKTNTKQKKKARKDLRIEKREGNKPNKQKT